MSKSTNAIQEIKKLMVQFGFMQEEISLQSFKLEDDTILQAEKLEAGQKIVKINEAFEQVELENGTYRLKENFEVEVSDGVINTVKEIFVDAVLKNGTAVKVSGDSVAVGAEVKVLSQDGSEMPAPDGVHELEDGTKIETKDGKIVKVEEVPADSEQGEVPESPSAEATQSMESQMFEMFKEFISKVNEKMSAMEEEVKSFKSEFNAFKSEPAAPKIKDGKTEQFNKQEDNIESKVNNILSLRNKI